jgi:hypothetical protein
MIRNKVAIEHQIDERLYQLLVPFEATLAELALVVDNMKAYVVSRIEVAEKEAAEKKAAEVVTPEVLP